MCSKPSSSISNQPINLHVFQNDFFREAIEHHILAYHAHFLDRLMSIYVWGSTHRNEAIPGISDIDLHAFICDTIVESDLHWLKQADERLKEAFPKTNGMSRPRPIDDFSCGLKPDADEYTRIRTQSFIIRFHYDSTLVFGQDLIKKFNVKIPKTRGYIQTHWHLTRYAAGLEKENKTDHRLPQNPSLRLRKLARLGVLGGAELLKAQGRFRSYKGTDIIPVLKASFPEWTEFLEITNELYIY